MLARFAAAVAAPVVPLRALATGSLLLLLLLSGLLLLL
jgi:hypothetical protein